MNSILYLNDFSKAAQWTKSSSVTAQPKKTSSTPDQIASLDRWTVIAALSSVASALYLMFA
jgi:hypothetical protein